jgi:hypothetical protein
MTDQVFLVGLFHSQLQAGLSRRFRWPQRPVVAEIGHRLQSTGAIKFMYR